ncbi:sensor histidine kinase [Paenibacillus puerhi]|uniref:sensor histidine kinase n=1 Tax=Paenibacillus puerhi TaxID=2692622 RepID=UPI002E288734|nr:histidine kinase [Paenibacillus puerhi]
MIEVMQEELQKERAAKAALEEREKMAQELHDGIAQSLFLLSVRVDRMEQSHAGRWNDSLQSAYQSLRKTVYEVNEYVRQAIASLRYPANPASRPWLESLQHLVAEFKQDTGIAVELNWSLTDNRLTLKEKVELYSTIREAMINVYKHAGASRLWVEGKDVREQGWRCVIKDDGAGFAPGSEPDSGGGFGLAMIRDRADKLKWTFEVQREQDLTMVVIGKEETDDTTDPDSTRR